jgi:hypothetical protein
LSVNVWTAVGRAQQINGFTQVRPMNPGAKSELLVRAA